MHITALLALNIICVSGQNHYKILKGKMPNLNGDILRYTKSRSKTQCTNHCDVTDSCTAVYYRRKVGDCRMYKCLESGYITDGDSADLVILKQFGKSDCLLVIQAIF